MSVRSSVFRPVIAADRVDYPALEHAIQKWWDEQGTLQMYLRRNEHSDKQYSFLDGPITANNPMGVHHAWGRTLKDLFQRYKAMRGFDQRYQNGFDSQGLWVEKAPAFSPTRSMATAEAHGWRSATRAEAMRGSHSAGTSTTRPTGKPGAPLWLRADRRPAPAPSRPGAAPTGTRDTAPGRATGSGRSDPRTWRHTCTEAARAPATVRPRLRS